MNAVSPITAAPSLYWSNGRLVLNRLNMKAAFKAMQDARDNRDDCQRESDDACNCGDVTNCADYAAQQFDERIGELRESMAEEIVRLTGLTVEQLGEVFA